jgi:Alginate export
VSRGTASVAGLILLLIGLSGSAQSQSPPQAPPGPRSDTTRAPARSAGPDYRNLRFDEAWLPRHRSGEWGDAIKAIPIASTLTLTLGGQLRWREEFFRDFNMTGASDDHAQSRLLLSADLHVGARARWHGRLFAEGRDAQSYGRSLPGGARPTDEDRHDVQNLFADIARGTSFVRYGRQEIVLNRERLFGVPDWANTRRGSQGTRIHLEHAPLALEVIDAHPVAVRQHRANRADSTQRFRLVSLGSGVGAAPLARGLPPVWQSYWILQTVTTPTAETRRTTSGGRLMWQWGAPKRTRRYGLELGGAVQRGTSGTREVHAWFRVAEASVQWPQHRGAPSLSLGVEDASGDNPATGQTAEVFTALYPAAHAHGGYADVIGRANVREWHAIGTWDPARAVALRWAWYRFDRLRLDEGIYNKQNVLFRAASGSTARHAADEVDVTGTWRASRHWRVIAGAAMVLPGPFMTETPGGASTERWGFVGTAFTF